MRKNQKVNIYSKNHMEKIKLIFQVETKHSIIKFKF